MLRKRDLVTVTAALLVMFVGALPTVASAQEEPAAQREKVVLDVDLKLERDGRLSVTEEVTVPEGTTVHRSVPLRRPVDDGVERVFTVGNAHVDGHGSARADGATFTTTLRPGMSTVTYSVGGAVAEDAGRQEVRWSVASGWDVSVAKVEVSFIAPRPAQSIECRVGPVGNGDACDQFQIAHTRAVRATHFDLGAGQRMTVSVALPPETVVSNARFEQTFSMARAFALTPASGAGLAGLGLLLIGGFGLLWYTRGRDARVLSGDVGPVEVLLADADGGVTFASPDGVLPGQVGTVIDEHVDVVDVTATVVDLAVRNYLWIEELPGEMQAKDWRIVRLNPPDDSLRPYERVVYELLLGTEHGPQALRQVLLSDLRSGEVPDLGRVRDELYTDVVDKNWFSRRPDAERNLFWWAGVGLAVAGVALTVVLALTTALALLGIGVVLGGIALTAGARLMPARAKRGSALVAQMRGLGDYLRNVSVDSVPESDREMVFSRSLPYAVVLGETERWLSEFAELDPGADGTPGLYWYGELVEQAGHIVPDLRRFRTHFPMLVSAMDEVLARASRLRTVQ
ncbi:DUF2207 family protein [Haloactinomyces albus]|uniref:Membrane protein DUF2207 n=1 Tax=Haloactinomyces albus TaxID=1352928 RepID=A0AAE3ZDH3_9ACTN|nr:DUF2207 domain-containing protein [Haloactinomyces albus]MDR7302898.1 hypothetical protein [Haloactinomyces albus]